MLTSSADLLNHYEFKTNFSKKVNQKHLRCDHTYTFLNKHRNKYVVSGHQYDYNFYAIKFYLKKHHGNKNRFKVLTGQYDAIRILNTVVRIMVDLKRKDTQSSFGFIGMPCKFEEDFDNTKRFKVYGKISKKYFNPENFSHIENSEKSTYLILDKKAKPDAIIAKIDEIIQDEFQKD